jgi:hypothetical protein
MSEVIKTKFLCKNGSRTSPAIGGLKWEDRFIEDKWYDGEYETWSLQLYRLNGGWKRYWVINEKGEKEEVPKAQMKVIFEFDIQQLRERKIKDIIDEDINS